MKLYRGLKTADFQLLDEATSKSVRDIWKKVLLRRSKGDFSFPEKLSAEIQEQERQIRLRRQHFTDNKEIAARYAKASGGSLVEIDVSVEEISRVFDIEFQNFGKRRKKFELVYVIDAEVLRRRAKKWKLKCVGFARK
jgi:hypothetical protein